MLSDPFLSLPYSHQSISSLSPGWQRVSFDGVLTNLSSRTTHGELPHAGERCLKLLLSSAGGEILIRLWYINNVYDFRLGQKLTVHTTHVSSLTTFTSSNTMRNQPASMVTSLFPEKDPESGIEIVAAHRHDHKTSCTVNPSSVTSLEDFLSRKSKECSKLGVLVMVLDTGVPTTLTTRNGLTVPALDVTVIDHSSLVHLCHGSTLSKEALTPTLHSTSLALPELLFSSTATFVPKHTVLFVTHPILLSSLGNRISISPCSQIHIDPSIDETILLRNWTHCLFPSPLPPPTSPPPFATRPSQSVSTSTTHTSILHSKYWSIIHHLNTLIDNQPKRKQYTLSLFLTEILLRKRNTRTKPFHRHKHLSSSGFVGYISVLITSLPLTDLYDQGKIFHGTCPNCNSETFSNSYMVDHTCRHHDDTTTTSRITHENPSHDYPPPDPRKVKLELSFNPALLAGFADETGGLSLPPPPPPPSIHQQHTHQITRHNLHLTSRAVEGITGLKRGDIFDDKIMDVHGGESLRSRLAGIQSGMLWKRVTLVVGWTGCSSSLGQEHNQHDQEQDRDDNEIDMVGDTGLNARDLVVVLEIIP